MQNKETLEQRLLELKEELKQVPFLDESLQFSFKQNLNYQINEIKKQLKQSINKNALSNFVNNNFVNNIVKSEKVSQIKENCEYEMTFEINKELSYNQLFHFLTNNYTNTGTGFKNNGFKNNGFKNNGFKNNGFNKNYRNFQKEIPKITLQFLEILDIKDNYYHIKTPGFFQIGIYHKFMKNYLCIDQSKNFKYFYNKNEIPPNTQILVTPKEAPFFEVKLTTGCSYRKINDYKNRNNENELKIINNEIKINENIYQYKLYNTQINNDNFLFYLKKEEFIFSFENDNLFEYLFYWDRCGVISGNFNFIVKGKVVATTTTVDNDDNDNNNNKFIGSLYLRRNDEDCNEDEDAVKEMPNIKYIMEGTEFEMGCVTFTLKK
ncbi:hypothetical protein ABK040_009724 [Willaertia magna]